VDTLATPLNLSRSALILIDFQRGVLERPRGTEIPPAAVAAVTAAGTVATAYRAAGLPVVLVGVHRRADYSDVAAHNSDAADRSSSSGDVSDKRLVEGTDDVDFAPELGSAPRDYLLVKRRVSAFFGTPLEMYLRRAGVETTVVGGVFTDGGVETTVRDAHDRDFDIVVFRDACWSSSAVGHDHAIGHLFPPAGTGSYGAGADRPAAQRARGGGVIQLLD
jgi:nicotinamidase-related amidase